MRTADLAAHKESITSQQSSIRNLETSLASQSESERAIRLRMQQIELELELANSHRQFYQTELENGQTEWQKARTETVSFASCA